MRLYIHSYEPCYLCFPTPCDVSWVPYYFIPIDINLFDQMTINMLSDISFFFSIDGHEFCLTKKNLATILYLSTETDMDRIATCIDLDADASMHSFRSAVLCFLDNPSKALTLLDAALEDPAAAYLNSCSFYV